jgi:hypothetical protein
MTLRDRISRWWSPAKWRDEHPEVSDGDGFALSNEQRLGDTVPEGKQLPKPADSLDLGRRH